MKTIFATILMMATVQTAKAADISIPAFATIAQIDNVDSKTQSIKLNSDGVITVERRSGAALSSKLNDAVASEIVELARSLSGVRTQTDRRQIVCKMVLHPQMISNLYVADLNNEMKLVLSYESCAISSVTYPINERSLEDARNLKAKLVEYAKVLAENSNFKIQPIANLE